MIADPSKTAKHNASDMLSQMPAWYYYTRPTNTSCHNLCTTYQPPSNFQALLGLGLTFCPRPRYTNFNIIDKLDRFRRDLYTYSFMAQQSNPIPRLFLRSTWEPPPHLINASLKRRTNNFSNELKKNFVKRKVRSNMLPYQRSILATLRQKKDFVVFPADKNLGPCILERETYIHRALHDHLLDTTTYQQLNKNEAEDKVHYLKNMVALFLERYNKKLPKSDIKYLKRSLVVLDPFAKFYITAKIHKKPWKTRPIVSISGSLLHGLGCWVDKVLQPFAKQIPSYLKSSVDLKDLLLQLPALPASARLFTCDAVSMYTNIDTSHAIAQIRQYLRLNNLGTLVERSAVLEALRIVMYNNMFEFGDTFWLQIDGTAMGVSPSCSYATLYFAPHENLMLDRYPELHFYRRYIDDVVGIWIPLSDNDAVRWESFQSDMNTFGKLRWEFSDRMRSNNFLDITITINTSGIIETQLYNKPENLYLYLPAHSTHPRNSLKGLVHGMVYRTLRLTSSSQQQHLEMNNLLKRLVSRGYSQELIFDIINKSYHKISVSSAPVGLRP